MTPAVIAFDFDGTLVDSTPGIARCMELAAAELGLAPEVTEAWRQLIGIPLAEQLRRLLPPDRQGEVDRGVELYRSFWAQLPEDELGHPFDGIPELLDRLAGRSRLALATSKSQRGVERALRRLGWETRFDPVVTSDQVAQGKPHPESLHRVLAHHGTQPGSALYVGDSRYDMETAAAAGIEAWGVTWGIHARPALMEGGAARCFDTPAQLREALGLA